MCRATDRQCGRNGPHLVAALVTWLVVVSVSSAAHAASVVDPLLRFKRLTTWHFVIYFHQGEDALADRLASIAERVYADMATRFGWTLPARTHVILVDQTDLANGWATPVPYNTIMVTAAWPAGGEFIGHTDDWLRLVFAHEFTHIAHLDRSRGWARAARTVFGRVPFAMPNLTLPGWQVEGMATYFESELTGRGRQFAGDFRAVEREPARVGRFMPLDRANGGLIAWPGGASVYSAGLGFHEHLAREYGADSLVRLADATAGRLPYLSAPAFGREFKRPLGRLWRDYQSGLEARTGQDDRPGASALVPARQLTDEAYDVAGARFLPPACDGCPPEIAYSVRNPHEFPAMKVIAATGGPARTLTTRYLGGAIGVSRTHLVFDQRELHRNVSLLSDLYSADRRSGNVRRLSSGLRLQDPDLSSDGRQVVATQQERGARHLVTAPMHDDGSLGPMTTLIAEADTQFVTPRWSPDGRRVAVERHRMGTGSEVVVVDVATRSQQLVATGATRAVTPAWRPDGRAIIAALDAPDGPFNVYEFTIDGAHIERRRLTATTGGALGPDVSADGQTLLYVGYTASGFDVFTQPYPAAGAEVSQEPPLTASTPPSGPTSVEGAAPAPSSQVRPYRPWPTLLPRAWTPLVTSSTDRTRIGFTTGGSDVLGYHGYGAAVLWRASAPSGAPGVTAGDPDWSVVYAYDRWLPLFYASASRDTSFLVGASAVDGALATLREQTLEAGIQLPIRRVLHSQRWLLSATRSTNTLDRGTAEDVFRRASLRTGWAYRSARAYGYSISPEDGVAAGIAVEYARGRVTEVDSATTVTADLRAYAPGVGRQHVVAMRVGGGRSTGSRELGRLFRLGGGSPNADPLDFGRSAFSLLRGFAPDSFAGRRVTVANVDYRVPLARIERGYGTWPLFIRQLHGSVFADIGHAWSDRFRLRDVKSSVGAEVATDVVIGFALPFTFVAGIARGHDATGRVPDTTTSYVRVGRAF